MTNSNKTNKKGGARIGDKLGESVRVEPIKKKPTENHRLSMNAS